MTNPSAPALLTSAPDNLVVSNDDITRIRADAEAARQASVLQQAFNASVSGITVFDAVRDAGSGAITDFRFVMVNEAGLTMSGYTRNELLGHTLWEIYPATGINGLFSRYVAVCETGQPFTGEHYYPEYDTWREVSVVPVANGVLVTYNDITARRKSEEAARQQTQFTENLLESIPAGIAVMNAIRSPDGRLVDFRVVQVNLVLQELFCLSPAQVLGRTLTVAFAFAGASGLLSRSIISVELGEQQEFEMPFGLQERAGWYRVSMAPQGDQVILAVTDISDTRRAQLAQHQEAELLDSVLDGSQNAIIAFEAVRDETGQLTDLRYVMQNAANEARLGRSDAQLIGHTMLEFFPSVRDNGLLAQYAGVIGTGVPLRTEAMFDYGQGAGWYDISAVRRGDGIVLTVMDITEQHNAQINQRQQADTFNAVLSHMMHGMNVLNVVRDETGQLADLRYEYVSEQVTRDTGLSRQQLTGNTLLTLFPGIKQSRFWQAYVQAMKTGENQQFEEHYQYDGLDNHVFCQVVRIDENRLVSTYQIINELKRQQQALEVANMELRRSNDDLKQFAYIASHDLQEPLRKIQSFGNIVATNYADVLDETGRDMVARMQKSAKRMSGLIRDLLNYSRMSTERKPFEPLSLTELLTTVVDDLWVAVRESGAVIEWDDLPEIMGDYTQLKQLFQNLLSNAIKFRLSGIPPRISITHRVLSNAALPLSVIGTANGKTVDRFYEINVTDNGIGFDEKYVDRIFQVFQRLHGRSNYAGTGVGLAICRKVAENHQGAITADSQLGAGATFRVYLPVVEG